jgi:hypothetical protein
MAPSNLHKQDRSSDTREEFCAQIDSTVYELNGISYIGLILG